MPVPWYPTRRRVCCVPEDQAKEIEPFFIDKK